MLMWWCGHNVNAPGHCSKVMLALAAPTLAQKPPGSHKEQFVARGALLNVPRAHDVQLWLPLPDIAEKDPGAHGMQLAFVAAPGAGK